MKNKYKLIKTYPEYDELGTIAEFYGNYSVPCYKIIKPNNNTFITEYIGIIQNNPEFWEEVIEKDYKIFTTKDGIDIFKGDTFYIIDNWVVQEYKNHIGLNEYIHNLKFSTKEKAEEYILLNKLCLSLNDVNEVFNNRTPKNKILYELKELVNTKING